MKGKWLTYYLTLVGVFVLQISNCQIVHEGSPYSWSSEDDFLGLTSTISLEEPNLNHVFAIDAANMVQKDNPYHFAYPIELPPNVNLESNFGTWQTLPNGDRIWTLIITVPNAIGLGLKFDDYHLPKDAKLFIYNQSHEQLQGAFTQLDNTPSNKLITLPIAGDHLIIEYFEPFEKIGVGRLSLKQVLYQYRNFESVAENECSTNARCIVGNIDNQLRSTVKIITNDGTKLGTGVLVAETGNQNEPYLITSSKLQLGDPANWHFIFNDYSISCDNRNVTDNYVSSVGAEIVALSESTETMLLKLKENPTINWHVYFSGWDRSITNLEHIFSLHYARGGICQIAQNTTSNTSSESELYIKTTDWETGSLATGSLGAPLYDENGLLIGIFNGGNIRCVNAVAKRMDSFASFSSMWEDYKTYLDPSNLNVTSSEGKIPPSVVSPKDAQQNDLATIRLFPVPAKEIINLYNIEAENTINRISIVSVAGQLIKEIIPQDEQLQLIDVKDFPNGWYVFVIYTKNNVFKQPVLIDK